MPVGKKIIVTVSKSVSSEHSKTDELHKLIEVARKAFRMSLSDMYIMRIRNNETEVYSVGVDIEDSSRKSERLLFSFKDPIVFTPFIIKADEWNKFYLLTIMTKEEL